MKKFLTNKNVINFIGVILFMTIFIVGLFISYNATQNRCYKKGGKPITKYTIGIPIEIYCEMSNE